MCGAWADGAGVGGGGGTSAGGRAAHWTIPTRVRRTLTLSTNNPSRLKVKDLILTNDLGHAPAPGSVTNLLWHALTNETVVLRVMPGPYWVTNNPAAAASLFDWTTNNVALPVTTNLTQTFSPAWGTNLVNVACLSPAPATPTNQTTTIVGFGLESVSWRPGDVTADDPASHGGGCRVYPEMDVPNGPVYLGVTAIIRLHGPSPLGQPVTVYYKIVDVDDPTAGFANGQTNVVDSDDYDGVFNGEDNRVPVTGSGIGITNAGLQQVTIPAGSNEVEVVFVITDPCPGNNWRVVAGLDHDFVAGIQLDTSGVGKGLEFVDTDQNPVPPTSVSPLLSVWRTLHVESDSMTAVTSNEVTGLITACAGTGGAFTNITVDQNLDDGSLNLSSNTNEWFRGRFEAGKIRIGSENQIGVYGNGNQFVVTSNVFTLGFQVVRTGYPTVNGYLHSYPGGATVTIDRTPFDDWTNGVFIVAGVTNGIASVNMAQQQITLAAPLRLPFVLHDDDHDDLLPYWPALGWFTEICADAYVKVVNDGGGNTNWNTQAIPFAANLVGWSPHLNINGFTSRDNRTDSYWVAWVCSAFQPAPQHNSSGDGRGDGDPNAEGGLGGYAVKVFYSDPIIGAAYVFRESFREDSRHEAEAELYAHELGHTFDLPNRDGDPDPLSRAGIMGTLATGVRFAPADINVIRNRVKSPGK